MTHTLLRIGRKLAAIFLIAMLGPAIAGADFVELESLLEKPGEELAAKLSGDAAVVAVRNGGQGVGNWNVPQAVGLEFAAALRRHDVDAIRAAADTRFEQLESVDKPFTTNHAKSLKGTDRQVLVGIEWLASKRPRVKISAFTAKSPKAVWSTFVDLPEPALDLEKNIPPKNRAIVDFARQALGKPVGDGDCTRIADEGLKAAGAGRRGPYLWGRMLGPREPWMPGDIVQMERISVTLPEGSRSNPHHTAVIENVRPDAITILHQNAFPAGKIVQRETWPLAGIDGYLAVFRAWDWPKKNPMPPGYPSRGTLALATNTKKKKPAEKLDLLKLIDPRIDRVQGVWFFEKGGKLRTPREFEARLQVAVAPPRSYSLDMTIERVEGEQCFGLGVTVGERQTMLEIDGDKMTVSGIHNLDGLPAKDNESSKQGAFLPLHKRVRLQCSVQPDQIALDIDGEHVIDWHGDAERLSVSPEWPVPHGDWLFLGAFDTQFEISSFTLDAKP